MIEHGLIMRTDLFTLFLGGRKMKRSLTILLAVAIVFLATMTADADVHVRGYFRSNGTYVQPHYRSNPDGNFYNNWSTSPNVNPYTGSVGTRITPSYSSGSYSVQTLPYRPSQSNSLGW